MSTGNTPGDGSSGSADVVDVDIRKTERVTVTFDDGLVCTFDLSDLRAACPCATCRGRRERGQPVWPRPGQPEPITIVDAQLNGAWGLSITWSDGHDTGIYAWANLRRWWEADMEPPIEDPDN